MNNLEDYAELVVDATIHTGIIRQMETFKSGFCQVCDISHFFNIDYPGYILLLSSMCC